MDSKEFKTVATYNEPMMANITAAMLNDNGIPASIFGFSSSYPSVGYARGIEVKVNAADYDEAMKLIEAAEKAD